MKPTFKKTVLDLVEWHQPIIFVIIEAYLTETIGYAGGIWLLWRSDFISMDILSATEQEIHGIVQVRSLSQPWLLSAIYGSPRFRERCIL